MKIYHLLFIVYLGHSAIPANAGGLLAKTASDQHLSTHPEKLLINAIENIQNNNTAQALKDLRQLITINPNFKAAQLVYADLMLARAQEITDFGNTPNVPFARITALRDEVRARWLNHKSPIDRNKIPAALVKITNTQDHIIVVDASRSRLFLFKNQNGIPTVIKDFYATIGKNGTGKQIQGDQKTPIGVYFVVDFISPETLPDRYGDGAFPINYPNVWDQHHGRTGYGIWLHGTPSKTYSRPPKDSKGCVIVSNQDLNVLAPFITKGRTPVIIADSIHWISKQAWQKRRVDYEAFVETWRQDWESLDVNLYLRHYSKAYIGPDKNYKLWAEYKRSAGPSKKFIKVNVTDISMFLYPGKEQLLVITFVQDYTRDHLHKKFTTRQYWRLEEDGHWRIIYEGAVT